MRRAKGFSLVEVVVATALLLLLVRFTSEPLITGQRSAGAAASRRAALVVAEQLAHRYLQMPFESLAADQGTEVIRVSSDEQVLEHRCPWSVEVESPTPDHRIISIEVSHPRGQPVRLSTRRTLLRGVTP